MFTIQTHLDTLAALNREHHEELLREAATERMLSDLRNETAAQSDHRRITLSGLLEGQVLRQGWLFF
jgi:hypothetical protein